MLIGFVKVLKRGQGGRRGFGGGGGDGGGGSENKTEPGTLFLHDELTTREKGANPTRMPVYQWSLQSGERKASTFPSNCRGRRRRGKRGCSFELMNCPGV